MWLLLLALARADRVDQILYVVGNRIVTTSDLHFEEDFDLHDRSPIPPMEDPAYPLEERLIDYAILRARAGDINVFKPSPAELRERFDSFRGSFEDPLAFRAFLDSWGLDDDRFQAFLYSRLVVEHYVYRTVGLAVQQLRGGPEQWRSLYAELTAKLRVGTVVRKP